MQELEQWATSVPRSRWFWDYQGLDVYVRYRDGVLTIANVTAIRMGQGAFTRFLGECEARWDIVVENVINERLEAFLKRRGYTVVENRDMGPWDYRLLRHRAHPGS